MEGKSSVVRRVEDRSAGPTALDDHESRDVGQPSDVAIADQRLGFDGRRKEQVRRGLPDEAQRGAPAVREQWPDR